MERCVTCLCAATESGPAEMAVSLRGSGHDGFPRTGKTQPRDDGAKPEGARRSARPETVFDARRPVFRDTSEYGDLRQLYPLQHRKAVRRVLGAVAQSAAGIRSS